MTNRLLTNLHWLIIWIMISLPSSWLHFISIAIYNMGNHFPENDIICGIYIILQIQYLYKTTVKQFVWNFSFHLNCVVNKLKSCEAISFFYCILVYLGKSCPRVSRHSSSGMPVESQSFSSQSWIIWFSTWVRKSKSRTRHKPL